MCWVQMIMLLNNFPVSTAVKGLQMYESIQRRKYYYYLFFVCFLAALHNMRILLPWPRIEPTPPTRQARTELMTPKEVPVSSMPFST